MADGRFLSSVDEGMSCISLDDLEPRLPPKISQFPIPFEFPEKPKPLVPDISLILDSQAPFRQNSFKNSPRVTPNKNVENVNRNAKISDEGKNNVTPKGHSIDSVIKSSNGNVYVEDGNSNSNKSSEEFKMEINSLVNCVKDQAKSILQIEEKIDKIIEFQEKFLSQLLQKGSSVSKEIQTDNVTLRIENDHSSRKSIKSSSDEMLISSNTSKISSLPYFRTRESSQQNLKSTPKFSPPKQAMKGPLARLKNGGKNEESFSAILKDIQLPNMHEPSVYSEASDIKSLELQEFNDDSFRSGSGMDSPILGGSAFCSSPSSDEELQNRPDRRTEVKTVYTTKQSSGRSVANKYNSTEYRRGCNGLESSRISGSSGSSSRESPSRTPQQEESGDEVVEATKKYLEKLGVQFGSPTAAKKNLNVTKNNRNYMIQQNVYNSIYIPTVKCVPGTPDALDSNANSGNFRMMAKKYVSPEELTEFDSLKGNARIGPDGSTETTVYGMSPNNLSFATKEYLQRYGLVNQQGKTNQFQSRNEICSKPTRNIHQDNFHPLNDRILDITAIKNQPKLL